MNQLENLIQSSSLSNNPLRVLSDFLEQQKNLEDARIVNQMNFVGYVLELNYDTAKIITSDPYKVAVGGIPRGSFLILVPNDFRGVPIHFTLLRVGGVSPTPLSNHVQQTYFELHKKSMPELDVWTQSELQWGALECDVLGMFYQDPNQSTRVSFSGDVNNVVSAHRYLVYSPSQEILNLIINGLVKEKNSYELGYLRATECQLTSSDLKQTDVKISVEDFKGTRTAMFGKTRLGKSNVVKLIAQSVIKASQEEQNVGQIIFDINGEYANDNPQDGNKSLRSAYKEECVVYALTKRPGTETKDLRLNFYEQPDSCKNVISTLLDQDKQGANYVKSFTSVVLPSIEQVNSADESDKVRMIRKIQFYWAILKKAGFPCNETSLKKIGLRSRNVGVFDPGFSQDIRNKFYNISKDEELKPKPKNLDELVEEITALTTYINEKGSSDLLSSSSSKKALFDADDLALLGFFVPKSGSGPTILRSYLKYHSKDASNFATEILDYIDNGKTVILDLGNATDNIRRYFSDLISQSVFRHQEQKFVNNTLGNHYVQLYFEEAHNLFPPNTNDHTGIYSRFAKEGAKFHIGMVYSTQSPSTISKELLAQTENFFVGHLSSSEETKALSKVQIAFNGIENDIQKAKTPGYMRMLTMSHRFVIPVQANKFEVVVSEE
jgi:Helicase HerA, central domain